MNQYSLFLHVRFKEDLLGMPKLKTLTELSIKWELEGM